MASSLILTLLPLTVLGLLAWKQSAFRNWVVGGTPDPSWGVMAYNALASTIVLLFSLHLIFWAGREALLTCHLDLNGTWRPAKVEDVEITSYRSNRGIAGPWRYRIKLDYSFKQDGAATTSRRRLTISLPDRPVSLVKGSTTFIRHDPSDPSLSRWQHELEERRSETRFILSFFLTVACLTGNFLIYSIPWLLRRRRSRPTAPGR